MAQEPILEATNIVKVLGSGAAEVRALKGVSLELMPGELTLLMGPSGSGKTTLLSILGCILTPSEGKLRIGTQEATGLNAEGLANLRRKHVGFVFQSYNLVPTLTALENVMLALELRGMDVDGAALAAVALNQVGLSHRAHAFPSKLSGGEKQRVAIARSLAGSPSVILADEPTAALGQRERQGRHGAARGGGQGQGPRHPGGHARPSHAHLRRPPDPDRGRQDRGPGAPAEQGQRSRARRRLRRGRQAHASVYPVRCGTVDDARYTARRSRKTPYCRRGIGESLERRATGRSHS